MELDEHGKVRVVEHKTRRAPSLPRAAQQQTAKLQVCAQTYVQSTKRNCTQVLAKDVFVGLLHCE